MRPLRLSIPGLAIGGILLPAMLPARSPEPAVAPGNTAAVQLVITAEARHGDQTPLLGPGDISAQQHERLLHVENVVPLRDKDASLELFVLLDDDSTSSLASQLGDLKHFIGTLPPATSVAVGYMTNGTVITVQTLTSDHAHAAASLRLPFSLAGGSPYLSLSDLVKRWPGKSGSTSRREVVMVSNGVDPLGGLGAIDPYLDNAIQDAQRAGIIVYCIYTPGTGHAGHSYYSLFWGQNHLAQLAEETGGESYMLGFQPVVSFAPYLNEIAGHLANQYRVVFDAYPEHKPGYQPIRFSTEIANADLVSATQVYVPAAR
jgi:hypothetical protein